MSRDPGDEDDGRREWDDFIGEVTDLGDPFPDDGEQAEG